MTFQSYQNNDRDDDEGFCTINYQFSLGEKNLASDIHKHAL